MARRPRRNLDLNTPPELAVHIVLDQSGSMGAVRDDTIEGFNTYIEELRKNSPTAIVGLTLFETEARVIHRNLPVADFPLLTRDTYVPSGWTALYDGIALGIEALDAATAPAKALVILTDGAENASTSNTLDTVRERILDRQEHQNWLITYLGANQDAFQAGGSLGVNRGTTMTFKASGRATRSSFAAASASTVRYGNSGSLRSASYTAEERTAAVDGDTAVIPDDA